MCSSDLRQLRIALIASFPQSACGPKYCSMKITQDIRDMAAAEAAGTSEPMAIQLP